MVVHESIENTPGIIEKINKKAKRVPNIAASIAGAKSSGLLLTKKSPSEQHSNRSEG